jgi:hypothetical protein
VICPEVGDSHQKWWVRPHEVGQVTLSEQSRKTPWEEPAAD